MSCCCASCDARMIELVQAIDDLRRSLVIVLQEVRDSKTSGSSSWDEYEQYG